MPILYLSGGLILASAGAIPAALFLALIVSRRFRTYMRNVLVYAVNHWHTARLHPTIGNETDKAGSFTQLDRFSEAGGTLIDTADVYADGRSESIIWRWLAACDGVRERRVVATKARFPPDESPNNHGSRLSDQLDKGMRIWNKRDPRMTTWQLLAGCIRRPAHHGMLRRTDPQPHPARALVSAHR